MDKPLTHKAERTLKKQIRECSDAIVRLDLNSTPTFPKDTRKYWVARRVRLRAALRYNERVKAAFTHKPLIAPEVFTLN